MMSSRFAALPLLILCACGTNDATEATTEAENAAGTQGNDLSAGSSNAEAGSAGQDAAGTGSDATAGADTTPQAGADPGGLGDDDLADDAADDTAAPDDDTTAPDDTADDAADDDTAAPDDDDTALPDDGADDDAVGDDTATDDTTDDDAVDDDDIGVAAGDAAAAVAALGTSVEEELEHVPLPRSEHGVGALNGEVYVLVGFTPSVTTSMEIYSPETDSWRYAADFPVVAHHPNVATVGNTMYVLGYHEGNGQRRGAGGTYAYDAGADAWTALTPMPDGTGRGASCVATYQDQVYIFGGTNDVALDTSSLYDPSTDSWSELPPLPIARHHCLAATVNDKIYLVSGRDVIIEDVQPESFVYDPATREYREVAPIPTPRGGAAGGALGGLIYVFGGEGNVNSNRGIFKEAEVYDPATDTWASLPDMEVPRHGFGAAIIGDRIYMPGGSTSQGIEATTTNSVFYYEAP